MGFSGQICQGVYLILDRVYTVVQWFIVLLICQDRDASVFGTLAPEPEIQVMDGGLSRMQFRVELFLPKEMVEGRLKVVYIGLL